MKRLAALAAALMVLGWAALRIERGPSQRTAPVAAVASVAPGLTQKLARVEDEDKAVKMRSPPPGAAIAAFTPEPGADDPGPGPYIQRYDGRSGRLSVNARPGGTEVTTRIPSVGPAPGLVVWVPSIRVQAAALLSIHATLVGDDQEALTPAAMAVTIAPRGGAPAPEQPLTANGDEFRYEGRAPAAGQYDYVVRAIGTYRGEPYQRVAGGSFMVHSAGGHIDPSLVRIEKRGGDLALVAPAQIDQAGTYWLYAELWGGKDGAIPIAFARDRFERLPAGAKPLSIFFGGAVIRDSGIDGPYLVRNVRFQQVDAFPPQEQEPIATLAATAAYQAAEFN